MNSRGFRRIAVCFLAVMVVFSVLGQVAAVNAASDRDTVLVIIELKNSDLAGVKASEVKNRLDAWGKSTQMPVIKFLEEHGAKVINSFWLNNSILARMDFDTLLKIRDLKIVEKIYPNFEVTIPKEEAVNIQPANNVTWGLDKINAPEVWNTGINGSGVRVAVLDTGVDISHPDLAGKMATSNSADTAYPGGWIEFDASGNRVTGSKPHDTNSHGTHTSGTVLGGNTSGTAIGVAPGAQLMHALILPGGGGSFAQVLAGMQWVINPVDQNGNPAGNPANVVSMSFGANGYYDEMIEPIKNMKAAGIIPVAAIGNDGLGTSGSPGNVYESFGVGATNSSDNVPSFSSGQDNISWPASWPTPYTKPDFSAPGVGVISAKPGGGYNSYSGTSMATPHVAGTIALMLSKRPQMSAEAIYSILSVTADDLGSSGKDVRYGWGIIDAYKAVNINSGIEGHVSNTNGELVEGVKILVEEIDRYALTGADGYYSIYLSPGDYHVNASQFLHQPQDDTLSVVQDVFTKKDWTLAAKPTGTVSGKVASAINGLAIEGASIALKDTPAKDITSSSGNYSLEVPVGNYEAEARVWAYLSVTFNVEIKEDSNTVADFLLEPFLVAVIGDWNSQIVNLLDSYGISAEAQNFQSINITDYNTVVVSILADPGKNTFDKFLGDAQTYKVGLVFTSSYAPKESGISLLKKYFSDPKEARFDWNDGSVFYKVTWPHPIFNGLPAGSKIEIIDGGDRDHAWFNDYSGITVADIGAELIGIRGNGIAFSSSKFGSRLLLAGLAPQGWTGIRDWTDSGRDIFVRGVRWSALSPISFNSDKVSGKIGEEIDISGLATPGSMLEIYNGAVVFGRINVNEQGNFSFKATIPEMAGGTYQLIALEQGTGRMGTINLQVKPSLAVMAPTEIGGKIKVDGKGFGSTAEIDLYYNGSLFATASANDLGTFSSETAIPFVSLPGVQQISALDGQRNFVAASFTIKNEWFTEFDGKIDDIIQDLKDANPRIIKIENGIAAIQTETGIIYASLVILDAKLTKINGNIGVVDTKLGAVQIDISLINAEVIDIKEGVAVVQTELGTVHTSLANLDAKLTKINGNIGVVDTKLGAVQIDISLINAEVIDIKEGVAVVQTDLGVINAKLNNFEPRISSIENGITDVKTGVKEAQAEVQTSIEEAQAEVQTSIEQTEKDLSQDFSRLINKVLIVLAVIGGLMLIGFGVLIKIKRR